MQPRCAGPGGGQGESRRCWVLIAGQETLDKVPQRSSLLREEGERQTASAGGAGSKPKCGGGWGLRRASPMDTSSSGTQSPALLPGIHHVDE